MKIKISKNIILFFASIAISTPCFLGLNYFGENMEQVFFWREMTNNPGLLTAQANQMLLEQMLVESKPFLNNKIQEPEIFAKSALSILFDKEGGLRLAEASGEGGQKVLFQQSPDEKLPIASITKLMTALVVLNNYSLEDEIIISRKAASQTGVSPGVFKKGEKFLVQDLIYPMLIESNNTAAYALAEFIGVDGFVELMNLEAKNLGMNDSSFVDPVGFDPDEKGGPENYSTANDLAKLAKYLLDKKPFVFEVLAMPEFDFYNPDGTYHHRLINSNELLLATPKMIGGKTGWTPMAKGCLLTALQAPKSKGYIVNVVLGTDDRFGEMQKLIDWDYNAFNW